MKIIVFFACLVLLNFSNVSASMDGHERSNAPENTTGQIHPFNIPERSHIYIQKLPAVQGDVLHGLLRRVTEWNFPLSAGVDGHAIVKLATGDHFSAFLSPFNRNYDRYNNGTQEYRCFITRPNEFGLVALLQPPLPSRPLDGLSCVYFIGPNRSFTVGGALQHSMNSFW